MLGTEKRTATFRRRVDSLPTLDKIPPRHNGVIPMKIKGHTIKKHTAYFITDQDSKKQRTQTYTSSMACTISREEHMLMFLSQTTPTNMSPLTKGNM